MNKGTKIYTRVVLDMTDPELPVIESESYLHDGDIAQCGSSGGGSSTKVVISDEEKKVMQSLYENMEYMKKIYRDNQLPYDLMAVEGNKELYPQYFDYAKQQIADATQDLETNRTVKDAMASKQLSDIERQDTMAQIEYENALRSLDRYNTAEAQLASERLGMLDADIHGVMGRATSDIAQSYSTQRDALERQTARLGVAPSSGMALEQNRLSALDFAKSKGLARSAARDTEIKRVDSANLERAKANWSKDIAMIQGGRQTAQNSMNYTGMLTGGYGTMYSNLAVTPQGVDLGAAAAASNGTAAGGPQAAVIPGQPGNGSMTSSLIGAGATLGAAWLMK